MKKLKRKSIIKIVIAISTIIVVGFIHYGINNRQYHKYCEGECPQKIVTNKVLNQVIEDRSKEEVKQIQKDKNAIDRATVKLDNANLNEEEEAEYQSYKIDSEYDSTIDYDVDQLIELAEVYNTALDNYSTLIDNHEVRILKDKIDEKQKAIAELQSTINNLSLSSQEQADYKQSLDYYNQIDYDKSKNYSLSELNVYLSEYGLSEVNFENDLQTYQMVR